MAYGQTAPAGVQASHIQPAPGRTGTHATRQLRLARMEGVTQIRAPGELRRRNLMERQQATDEGGCGVRVDGSAFGQDDGVGQVRPRHAASEPRGVGDLGCMAREDEFVGRCGGEPALA